jgi:glycosyltransferase involved in cell wall biosynthesis
MTSDHEGLPMVLLEAMCLQIPIIAHAVGGIPHLLDQGTCGILVKEHTPKAFAKAVIKLINEPEHHQQLAFMAFERVKQSYSAKHTATAYLDVYKQITSY